MERKKEVTEKEGEEDDVKRKWDRKERRIKKEKTKINEGKK